MSYPLLPILSLLIFLSASSYAGVSFFVLKDAYDAEPGAPQIYRFDGVSNFQSGIQASITTRIVGHGRSGDIAIDEQGQFYFINGFADLSDRKDIYRWSSISAWANNTGTTLLGYRGSTTPISGFSVYQNEFYFLEGDPNTGGNKTLRKWASLGDWASGAAGTLLGTRSTGPGLGFEIDAGGAVWYLDGSTRTSTSGILYRWNSINDFLNNTNYTDYGGSFTFAFSGSSDQVGGLAVPEPSSSFLLLASFATLTLFRRRSF